MLIADLALDPLPVWIARAGIATLFAQAALTKLADPALFEQHLAAYRVPLRVTAVTARAVPLVEAAAAALLLTPWRSAGALLAIALLLVYGAAMAWHHARGRVLDCGCGGEPLDVSWALVARNAVLAALAALAGAPVGERVMALADFGVVAGSVLLGCLLYAALHQVLRHRGRAARVRFGRT
jgi:uncharacterized membrane protein YphA (DoxX/SURF4 family)